MGVLDQVLEAPRRYAQQQGVVQVGQGGDGDAPGILTRLAPARGARAKGVVRAGGAVLGLGGRHASVRFDTVIGRTVRALVGALLVALEIEHFGHGRVGADENQLHVVGRGFVVIGPGDDRALAVTHHGENLALDGQDREAPAHTGGQVGQVSGCAGDVVRQVVREGDDRGGGGAGKGQVVHGVLLSLHVDGEAGGEVDTGR